MELTFVSANKNIENLVEWIGAPPPKDVKIRFENESANKTTAIAEGLVDFRQRHEFDDNFQYFLAVKGPKNKLICRPAKLHRMMPCYDKLMTQFEDEKEQLTRREQLDELKTKFGSKKTQRQNVQKRKYEIQFGDEDVEDLPTLNSNNNSDNSNPTSPSEIRKEDIKKEEEVEEKVLTSILPKRNAGASKIEDVYNFRDIITDEEYEDIILNKETLSEKIKFDFVKRLCEKSDDQGIVLGVYADLLMQMLKLTLHEMKKDDPMPHIESDIKKYIFERYTTTETIGKRMRYVITSANKDRINTYAIILLFILSKFKPIDMEILKNNFKYPIAKLRRLLEVIGAYFETSTVSKGASIKVARLKLPLNMPKENNKKFKR